MTEEEKGTAFAQRLGGEAGKMAVNLGAKVLSQSANPLIGQLSGYRYLRTLFRNEYGAKEQNEVIDAMIALLALRRHRSESVQD